MLKASPEGPPPMLRRMKADELEGLPKKVVHIRKRAMPEAQARVYAEVVARAKSVVNGTGRFKGASA